MLGLLFHGTEIEFTGAEIHSDKYIQAAFEIETRAKTNFPSYHRGCFQEKRHFNLPHHQVKSDNTPNENLQSFRRVMKKLASIFTLLYFKYEVYSFRI